jgi:hypothetical protein
VLGSEFRIVFLNLYSLKDPAFRNHNFNDFGNTYGGREAIEQATAEWIVERLKGSFEPDPKRPGHLKGIEPYFHSILPMTLSVRCENSFIRSNPALPINSRDYFLSKLLQFLIEALTAKYGYDPLSDMEAKLHEILDRVPSDRIPPAKRIDCVSLWWETYWDCHDCEAYGDVLDHLATRIDKLLADPIPPVRRPGPKPDAAYHRTICDVVKKYNRQRRPWKENLDGVCAELDRQNISVRISREEKRGCTWSEKLGSPGGRSKVIKAINYSLMKSSKKNG